MTSMPLTLIVYSLQLLCLIVVATAAAALFRLPLPAARFAYWRGVGALCVALPFVSWLSSAARPSSVSFAIAAAAFSHAPEPLVAPGDVVMWAWAVGVILCLFRIIAGILRLRRMRAGSRSAVLSAEIERLRRMLAPRATLRWSDEVTQPVTFGLFQPVILLPARLRTMTADEQRTVACHELLHVARRDWTWIVVEEHVRVLFWFHPAVWWLLEQVQLSREQLVDQLVVKHTGARRAYMNALLVFADARPVTAPSTALLRRHHLKSRLRQLSKEVHMSRTAITVAASVLFIVLGSAAAAIPHALPLEIAEAAMTLAPAMQEPARAQDDGVRLPVVISEVKPEYTRAALEARIQGVVVMEVIVLSNGTVGEVAVVKSLDTEYGLDEEAVRAAQQWLFRPGTKNGTPVAVQVTLEMRFTLK